jgi:pimeloyl-ACP methyl ester carboxylesterase
MGSRFIRRLGRVGLTLAVLSAIAGVCYLAFPLELSRLRARFDLWRDGVSEVRFGAHLAALERDHCPASGTGCDCVLLVHGLGDDSLTWRRLLQSESRVWLRPVRLIAPDLPGVGASPPPLDPVFGYRVGSIAAALAEGMAATARCERWIVAGNSFGGWIAARMAVDYPTQLHRLVLVGATGLKAQIEASASEAELISRPTVDSMQEFQRRAYHRPRPLPRHVWWAAVRRARSGNARAMREAQSPDEALDGRLARVTAPSFLFWGESDRISPPAFARAFAAELPGAHLTLRPECGHLPQKECPEALIGTINSALAFGTF